MHVVAELTLMGAFDLPHVAGIIKGNLCPPPIFPRPFTLIPLPSLSSRPTTVSPSSLTPLLSVFL